MLCKYKKRLGENYEARLCIKKNGIMVTSQKTANYYQNKEIS